MENNLPIETRLEELQSLIWNFCKDNPDLHLDYITMDYKELMVTYSKLENNKIKQYDVILENENLL